MLLFELYILKHIIFILKPIICWISKNLSPSYYTLLYALYILFYLFVNYKQFMLVFSVHSSFRWRYGPTKSRWWARSASRHANPPNPSTSFISHSGSSTCYCAASLLTMSKDVRRAMLPNNDEVLKKSFAEGIENKHTFKMSMGWFRVMFSPGLDGNQVLDF